MPTALRLMFDLDGTLTDSQVGVTRCIQHALADAGIVAPPIEELTRYVGPPLLGAFETLLGTSDARRIERAFAAYRRRFEQFIMIGDRAEDVRGAKSNGVGSVAVTWGYGAREELEAAQPDRLVASSRELVEYVLDGP